MSLVVKKIIDLRQSNPTIANTVKLVLFYTLASIYYNHVEGWSVGDCIYFLTVTITTVGYGDFHPTTDPSRMFTVFVILIGLVFIFGILAEFANKLLNYMSEKAKQISKETTIDDSDPYKYLKKRLSAVFAVVFLVLIGTFVIWQNEGWTFIEAFYTMVVTTTTVGYGDLVFQKYSSRVFMIFYIPLSVVFVAGALGQFTAVNMEIEAEKKKIENLTRKLDFQMIREMDTNGDGVDKCEFLVAMLVSMGTCDLEKDINPWLKRFDELDVDGSGKLDEDDIKLMERQEADRIAAVTTKVRKSSAKSVVFDVVTGRESMSGLIADAVRESISGVKRTSTIRRKSTENDQPSTNENPPISYDIQMNPMGHVEV